MKHRQLIDFLEVIGKLKTYTRHVWDSNRRQESVADHCWRLSVMALLVAEKFPHLDFNKIIRMCLIHDFGEALTGDIPSFYKTESDKKKEDLAVDDLLKLLPEGLAAEFSELFVEMEELKTEEAKLFKALDRLEAIASHNESPLDTWLELEYTENLVYGNENVGFSEYLTKLRDILREDSIRKIESGE